MTDATLDVHSVPPDRRRTMLPRMETEAKHAHNSKLVRSQSVRSLRQTELQQQSVSKPVHSTHAAEAEQAKSGNFSADQSAANKMNVLRPSRGRAMIPRVKADDQHHILKMSTPTEITLPSKSLNSDKAQQKFADANSGLTKVDVSMPSRRRKMSPRMKVDDRHHIADISTPTGITLSSNSLDLDKTQQTFADAKSGLKKVNVSMPSRRRKMLPPAKAAHQLKALKTSTTTTSPRSATASSQPIPGT